MKFMLSTKNTPVADEEYAILTKDLVKSYKVGSVFKNVLDGVSLSIKKGSIYGILGPNGAGKTTIINIISGIIKKTSGDVFIDGIDLERDINSCKYKIGTAIQEVMLDPFFSVLDYLKFTAGYYNIPKSVANTRILEICQSLDLTPHLKKNTRMLSGGMKRRLIIAKALLHDPDIIILDEPTAGVDIELRNSLWMYVKKLNKMGKTIILTTHYLEEAQEFCDRIAFIDKGRIILEDSKDNILRKFNTKKIVFSVSGASSLKLPSGCVLAKNDNLLELTYNPNNFDLSEFFTNLHESGVKIYNVSSFEPSLDDVFISIFKTK